MKEFNDDMFIVINKKRFAEMGAEEGDFEYQAIHKALASFVQSYGLITGKTMNQKYIVCNQDEPYAEQVKAIILGQPDPRDALIEQMGIVLKAVSDYRYYEWSEMGSQKERGLAIQIDKALAELTRKGFIINAS